jgi:hypothetical protein
MEHQIILWDDILNRLCVVLTLYDRAEWQYTEQDVSRSILETVRAFGSPDQPNSLFRLELLAFQLFKMHVRGEPKGANGFRGLGVDTIDDVAVQYWYERAVNARHPVLKGRYADLCWVFWPKIFGKVAPIEIARIVVVTYLDQVESKAYKRDGDAIEKLKTALSVSLSINDREYIRRSSEAIVILDRGFTNDRFIGLWGFAYDNLVSQRNVAIAPHIELSIIRDLEARLGRCLEPTEETYGDDLVSTAAGRRLAQYYRRKQRRVDEVRVIRAMAQVLQIEVSHGSMLHRVETAYKLLRTNGLRDEAEILAPRLRTLGLEMRAGMHMEEYSIEIPTEEMKKWVDGFVEMNLSDALTRLMISYVPRLEEVRESIRRGLEEYPLATMIPKAICDRYGRTICVIGSPDEDPEGREINEMLTPIRVRDLSLDRVFEALRTRGGLTAETLLTYLSQSPVFDGETTPFLALALESYFAGQYVIAAHLLVPQLENAARRAIELLGGDTYKPRNGALHLISLDEILRSEKLKKLFGVRGEEVVTYLRAILTDQRGLNLRNDICHGMCAPESLDRRTVNRLIHLALILSQIRTNTNPVESESQESQLS